MSETSNVSSEPTVYESLLCWRLTTDTGSILELWELNTGDFELLVAEAHRPEEVVCAVTLSQVEAEMVGEKFGMATTAANAEPWS